MARVGMVTFGWAVPNGGTVTVLVIFLLLALIFGIGGVIKGVLWAILIGVLLLVVGGYFGWRGLTQRN